MLDPVKIKLARKQLWKNELNRMRYVEDVLDWWGEKYAESKMECFNWIVSEDGSKKECVNMRELVMKRLRVIYRKGNTKQ